MEEIIYRQRDAAKALTGKTFMLAVASVVVRLAIAQVVVNLLITATGWGLIGTLFYLYAIWLLVGFMRRTVASHVYTLKRQTLILERKLGDSTTTVVEIPFERIAALRPVFGAERLHQAYRQVTVIDPACKPTLGMRLAFGASLFSAHLARALAGKRADAMIGHVVVYAEDGKRRACVFRPDEQMCAALAGELGGRFGLDERLAGKRDSSLFGRALERAFPCYYAFVDPLVKKEDIERAEKQLMKNRAEREAAKKAAKAVGERAAKARSERRKKQSRKERAPEQTGEQVAGEREASVQEAGEQDQAQAD